MALQGLKKNSQWNNPQLDWNDYAHPDEKANGTEYREIPPIPSVKSDGLQITEVIFFYLYSS
jgi:hypothetical protein